MIKIAGSFYDGMTSQQVQAVCSIADDGTAEVGHPGSGKLFLKLSASDINVSPRIADTNRYLSFPGDRKLETADNASVDEFVRCFYKKSGLQWLYQLESSWGYVLVSFMILVLFGWLFAGFGVPAAARTIAFHLIPAAAYETAGQQALTTLDKIAFKPSEIPPEDQAELIQFFDPMIRQYPDLGLNIIFRKGGSVGPNAFALPNGAIIFTDEMIRISEDKYELTPIMAHEIGHVVHRHNMRSIIQKSFFSFVLLAITGDISGTSELFLTMPVYLTELAYSRDFEDEADDFALNYLRDNHIKASFFSDILMRIETKKNEKTKTGDFKWMSYLSTHPRTEDRLKKFKAPN